eukprot:scaffold4.g4896.t1
MAETAQEQVQPAPRIRLEDQRTVLRARSLANVLNVIKRRLQALQKHGTFTKEDGQHFNHMLEEIDGEWRDTSGTFAGVLSDAVVSRLFNECWDLLDLNDSTAVAMAPEVEDIHGRLLELRRRVLAVASDPQHTLAEAVELQAPEAREPQAPGVTVCNELLNTCYETLAECLRTAQDVGPEMAGVYDRLRGVKNALRRLAGKRKHTLEDLQHYQGMLAAIDGARKNGVFCGDGGHIPHGQAAAAELLQECYDLVEQLADTATDMDPELRALHGRLEALRHALEAAAAREGPPGEELNDIDDQRAAHAGVFAFRPLSREIPAGQASQRPPLAPMRCLVAVRPPAAVAECPPAAVCSSLLNLCYRELHDLYMSALQEQEQEQEQEAAPAAAEQ